MAERLAVLHLDGDSFFASVEAAKDPSLRGRPIVTGRERGIATAMSAEAKRLGIGRSTPIFQIRKEWPQVVIVDSDYEAYATYCHRMMEIVRRSVSDLEEYSIDECFATLPLRLLGPDPAAIAEAEELLRRIQGEIWVELGITVSLGLAPTKVLAKVASKTRKPRGVTVLPHALREEFLRDMPVGKVWGIGSRTAVFLGNHGVRTALDLARMPEAWVMKECDKRLRELWHELRGEQVLSVETEHDLNKSVHRTRSFSPASDDRARVYGELSRNAEGACAKLRHRGITARHLSIFLKTSDFTYARADTPLPVATASPTTLLSFARALFDRIYMPGTKYRATGVLLSGIAPEGIETGDLFGATDREEDRTGLFRTIDRLGRRFGEHAVHVASSTTAIARERAEEDRRLSGRGYLPGQKAFSRPLVVPFLGDVF